MHSLFSKLKILFVACRGYSIPISVISWLVPFLLGVFNSGNALYGFISLFGIVVLHLATNIFDDAIDYTRELFYIKKGFKSDFIFQKGKCICILENKITLKQTYLVSFILFFIALSVAVFFICIWGIKLLYVLLPSAFICILYPVLGCLGFGEILVSLIFSPLIYIGVYFIMTGNFSFEVLILSISTGLLSVAVLHNHMLLDYKYDTSNRKITLCRICGSEKKALILLAVIVGAAYINLFFFILFGKLNYYYMLPFITIPNALVLLKVMNIHVKNPEEKIQTNFLLCNSFLIKNTPEEQKNFLIKFLLVENLLITFTIVLCISIVISNFIINN